MSAGAQPTGLAARSRERLRLAYVDAAALGAGAWRLTIGFAPAGDPHEAIRAIPPDALHLRPADGLRHAGLRATRTAWAEPGRVLTADVALHGASTAAGAYLLRIDCPDIVDPAAAAARFDAPEASETEAGTAPALDYLTKDYVGFRHLMLTTINRLLPRWSDGSEADIGVTIVESLAYGADFLSYYQDAVATEAYLDTARRRTSIRRHLRLLGYRLGEGCASRLLMRLVATPGPGLLVPAGTAYIAAPEAPPVADADDPSVARTLADGRAVYTQIADAVIVAEFNQLELAAPGRLRAGATRFPVLSAAAAGVMTAAAGRLFGIGGTTAATRASLHPFRARAIVPSGAAAVGGRRLCVIEADPEEALPWDLDAGAVIVGNLVPAEFGRLVGGEVLPPPEPGRPYRPTLAEPRVVPVAPVDPRASAAALLAPSPATAVAAVTLREILPNGSDIGDLGGSGVWHPTTDLLGCSGYARRFVVEADDDGVACLRFGDGWFGRRPPAEARLMADYRVGTLTSAAVGTGQLDTLVAPTEGIAETLRTRILAVSNPIPSQGLHYAEAETRAILHGKAGFRIVRTCVALEDFAAAAREIAPVAEAIASVRRAGSAEVIVIRVRSTADLFVPEPLLHAVRREVEGRMLPGRRLAVLGPRFARLSLAVAIRPLGGADPDQVRQAVAAALSARPEGLFAPERLAFGQPIFASRVLQVAAGISGVASARVLRLQRVGATEAALSPKLSLDPDEIPVSAHVEIEMETRR